MPVAYRRPPSRSANFRAQTPSIHPGICSSTATVSQPMASGTSRSVPLIANVPSGTRGLGQGTLFLTPHVSLVQEIQAGQHHPEILSLKVATLRGAGHPEIPSLNRAPQKSANSSNWPAAKQACVDHLPEEAVKKTSRPKGEGGMH